MTGEELFGQIILFLNQHLEYNDDVLSDFVETDENLEEAFTYLKSLNPPTQLNTFIEYLDKIRENNAGNFLNTPYSNSGNAYTINFSQDAFARKNRRFAYGDATFSFVSSKALFDNGNLVDISDSEFGLHWKQIEFFLERIFSFPTPDFQRQFFDSIINADTNLGFVVLKNEDPFDEQKHYSYFYLTYLNNSNSVLLPEELKYQVPQILPNINFDGSKIYQQYFDIYDVLNELNQAPDILNRFLRMYHTLEYLVYRVYLVELVTKVGTSRLFVREFISSAESMKSKEKESFLKNFKTIFDGDLAPTIRPALHPDAGANVVQFLADKNIVKGFTASDVKKVAELIYGIRCSIVHNKEGAYHLTLSNSEDYQVIIPLITKLLAVFETLVVKKVSENNPVIHYPQPQLNLY